MKFGFVFTNYNNSAFTRAAVRSIAASPDAVNCFVVIVDNKSEADDVQQLLNIKADYPDIHLILNEENLGYFRGLNVGIEYLRANHKDIDFVTVGNNDLVFPDDFTQRLNAKSAFLATHAVISPDLLTLDGVHQNPHVVNGISKTRMFIWDLYYANYRLALAIKFAAKVTRRFTERKDFTEYMIGRPISEGYGACYILTPLFFKHFRLLWSPTFLMGEEYFLSKQLESKGFRTYYEPGILVNHHDHATLNKVPSKKLWSIARDAHKVYRKYVDRSLTTDEEFQRACWTS